MSSDFLERKSEAGEDDKDNYTTNNTNNTNPYIPQPLLASLNGETSYSYSNTARPVDIVQLQSGEPFVDPVKVQLQPSSPPDSCPSTPDLFTPYLNGDMSGLQFDLDHVDGTLSNFIKNSGPLFGQQKYGSQFDVNQMDFTGMGIFPTTFYSQEGYGFIGGADSQPGQYGQDIQTTASQSGGSASSQQFPWGATSRVGQASNVPDHTLAAQQHVRRAWEQLYLDFPNGATTVYTSGEALECALSAIRLSFIHQLPLLRPPLVDELRAIGTSNVDIVQRFRDAGEGPIDANNFNAGHVAAILEEYGRLHLQGHALQLGVVWTGRDPFIQYAADPLATTVWIHNDNAQSASTLGHYSGLKANNVAGGHQDQLGQYDETEQMYLGPSTDQPTSATASPTLHPNTAGADVVGTGPSGIYESLWPTRCYNCNLNALGMVVQYWNWIELLLHDCMVHPNRQVWIPQVCFWERCNCSVVYLTVEEWLTHVFTAHKVWTPQPCPREDCKHTVEAYPTWNKCLKHIFSVHNKRYRCENPAPCEVKRKEIAFGTLQDKQKHDRAIHELKKVCPLPYCRSNQRLNRNSHRKKHMEEWHGSFCCKFEDPKRGQVCSRSHISGQDYGYATQAELHEHTKKNRHMPARRRGN